MPEVSFPAKRFFISYVSSKDEVDINPSNFHLHSPFALCFRNSIDSLISDEFRAFPKIVKQEKHDSMVSRELQTLTKNSSHIFKTDRNCFITIQINKLKDK